MEMEVISFSTKLPPSFTGVNLLNPVEALRPTALSLYSFKV